MIQEDKKLLLKDLLARLPYGVKCNALLKQIDGSLKSTFGTFKGYNNGYATVGQNLVDIETVRPYLRPVSSMTEEEIVEINSMGFAYWTTMINNDLRTRGPMSLLDAIITHHKMVKLIDWLNEHHFDYRGLIEKGLATEVTEENDPYSPYKK